MLESLGFSLPTFVITIINIVLLTLIFRAILFKPVTKFMADRAKRVQDSIDQAQQDRDKAQALLAQYEGKLKNAEAEAEAILKAARDEAEAAAQRIVGEGRGVAESVIANARRQIEAEQTAAMAKFSAEAVVLVMAAAAQLLQRELNSDDNRRFAGQLLEELSKHGIAQKGNI